MPDEALIAIGAQRKEYRSNPDTLGKSMLRSSDPTSATIR
jgi:hypothetical protein